MAGPVFGAVGTTLSGSGATANFPVPTGVAANHGIVVAFFLDSTATVTAMPSGFAHAQGSPVPVTGTPHSLVVAEKLASGADSGTYDFTLSASVFRVGAAARWTGCVTSGTLFDAPTATAVDTASGTASPPVSVTTLGADRLLIHVATNWAGGAWTPSAGFTERVDSGENITVGELAQAVAGGSGSVSATCVGSDKRAAWLGAMIPAAPVVEVRQGVNRKVPRGRRVRR